jgi:ribosome maturation factor RimP
MMRPEWLRTPKPMEERLTALAEPVVAALGFYLVAIRFGRGGPKGHGTVRLFIEGLQPGMPVTIEDCATVSREVGTIFDVENPIAGRYHLEVSTPGVERPLLKRSDFERFCGFQVRLHCHDHPEGGSGILTGCLKGLNGEEVLLATPDGELSVHLTQISSGHLDPQLSVGSRRPLRRRRH